MSNKEFVKTVYPSAKAWNTSGGHEIRINSGTSKLCIGKGATKDLSWNEARKHVEHNYNQLLINKTLVVI